MKRKRRSRGAPQKGRRGKDRRGKSLSGVPGFARTSARSRAEKECDKAFSGKEARFDRSECRGGVLKAFREVDKVASRPRASRSEMLDGLSEARRKCERLFGGTGTKPVCQIGVDLFAAEVEKFSANLDGQRGRK